MKRNLVLGPTLFMAIVAVLLVWACNKVRGESAPGDFPPTDFRSAASSLNLNWALVDLRPPEERLDALHRFVSEDYSGLDAFSVPSSLLAGNPLTRVLWDQRRTLLDEVGLTPWPENPLAPFLGIGWGRDSSGALGLTSNCLLCHSAEVDGQVYFGAGAKVFDEKRLVEVAARATGPLGRLLLTRDPQERRRFEQTHRILGDRRHPKTDPLTRGRSTAFLRSHVELYRAAHQGADPPQEQIGRADSKIPPLWHYAPKKPFGRWYLDGSFHAEHPLLASTMELAKGRSLEELASGALPTIARQFDETVQMLRPPPYPHAIDEALAAKGKSLFESPELECSRCHGTYRSGGQVEWPGRYVDVGTDPARRESVSPHFVEAFSQSPLAAVSRLAPSPGYAAPPLSGVWVNFPYLHNGSVPTLYHLLGPTERRPRIFSVKAARRFDSVRVGQVLWLESEEICDEPCLIRRFGNDRDWFYSGRAGAGNQGHDFWNRIGSEEHLMALIEYLKTL